jgi:hypothetical protein
MPPSDANRRHARIDVSSPAVLATMDTLLISHGAHILLELL